MGLHAVLLFGSRTLAPRPPPSAEEPLPAGAAVEVALSETDTANGGESAPPSALAETGTETDEAPAPPATGSTPATLAAREATTAQSSTKARHSARRQNPRQRRTARDSPATQASVADGDLLEGAQKEARTSALQALVLAASVANERDPAWHELPIGPAGELLLELSWEANSEVHARVTSARAPAHLVRVAERTAIALRMATRRGGLPAAGKSLVRLRVVLGTAAREETETTDPTSAVEHSRRFPAPGQSGLAAFRYPSGRTVNLIIDETPL